MKYDLVAIVSEMFNQAGVGDVIQGDLNNHSAITLNMKDDIPQIHLKCEDDEVWVWAVLCEYNKSVLAYNSSNVFSVMFNYNENFFYGGQPYLYPVNGDLELRAQVKEEHLTSSDGLLNVLDLFFNLVNEYRSVLI